MRRTRREARRAMVKHEFTIRIRRDDDGALWGEVGELPGCFISGADVDELLEAAAEAIGMYLADDAPQTTNAAPPAKPKHEPISLLKFPSRRARARLGKPTFEPQEAKILLEG